MLPITVQLQCPLFDSFRVRQVAGMFDLQVDQPTLGEEIRAEVPSPDEPWSIGVIVGPSGSGKTSLARAAFGPAVYAPQPWPADRAVIDCLGELPIKQLTRTLTAVGLSAPRTWLKPYAVLSNGERFRCELARALLTKGDAGRKCDGERGRRGDGEKERTPENVPTTALVPPSPHPPIPPSPLRPVPPSPPTTVVFDEFTSVVDRTVARIASAAVSKAIRSGTVNVRFVAVTCHYDVVRWLGPDWVLDMSGPSLSRGRVRCPPIALEITRCDRSIWSLFERHHYLTGSLHRGAACFLARFEDRPAAFAAVLPFPHPRRPGWREHRLVCLPDFQGVGIGSALSDFVASCYVATGKPYFSTTSHPAMIHHRAKSPLWKMHRAPAPVSRHARSSRDTTCMADSNSRGRVTAGFEYVGPPRLRDAWRLGVARAVVKSG
ncbi:MAG TPA: GNAT family N-acetyltransferase [Tepidisphaeraceae bacterium]